MRVVIDTNSLIAQIILLPKSRLHFYSTDLLSFEIEGHKDKLKRLADYDDFELNKTISLITSKIRFINANLIPTNVLVNTQNLTEDVDINDTEFVALTTHIRGKLWSGDKILQKGLTKKGWNKFISTGELYQLISKKK